MTQKGGWRLVGALARSLTVAPRKFHKRKNYFKRLKIIIKIKITIKHFKMFETGILPLKVRVVGWGGFTAVTNSAS